MVRWLFLVLSTHLINLGKQKNKSSKIRININKYINNKLKIFHCLKFFIYDFLVLTQWVFFKS